MKTYLHCAIAVGIALALSSAVGQTTWQGANATWSTAGNWSAGSPATGPQLAIYPGNATIQSLDLAGGTGRVSIGARFDLFAGGSGYTFFGTAGTVIGFIPRAGGTVNGILNNDDNTQTFNVPIKLTSSTGVAGPGAAMTFNAAAGSMIFNGNNTTPAANWTINLNGATALTFDGAFNITIGSSGPGQIVNTNSPANPNTGLIKNGIGTLTLGGTAANTFTGVNKINAGLLLAAKVNALGSGNALVMSGGTFGTGGLNQSLGTLDLDGTATLDLGSGASAVSFANSSAIDWSAFNLNIANWTVGVDTIRFGTDNSGLTQSQLDHIIFTDLDNATAQIDPSGFISPVAVPEPQSVVMFLIGIAGLMWINRNRVRA
jgi:autotransporter-associated beta strand protein